MHTYVKGANAERELTKLLKGKSFAVVRSARSGGSISVPDVIAAKDGKILAFECKTWKEKPRLKREEHAEFAEWCQRAGAIGFLAWRNRGKWLFLDINNLKEKNIAVDGLGLEELTGGF